MKFVQVRHTDGRTADITAEEVGFYQSIGFEPVDGSAGKSAGGQQDAAGKQPQSPADGTNQRLDSLIDEVRGLRADLAAAFGPSPAAPVEPVDGQTIELREPGDSTEPEASTPSKRKSPKDDAP